MVDAAIMLALIGGSANAPAMMIAKMAADMIARGDWSAETTAKLVPHKSVVD